MSNHIEKFASHFKHNFALFIISAIGFVVALQWQSTIQAVIDNYFPSGSGIFYKLITSVALTIFAIPLIYVLSKLKHETPQPVYIVDKK